MEAITNFTHYIYEQILQQQEELIAEPTRPLVNDRDWKKLRHFKRVPTQHKVCHFIKGKKTRLLCGSNDYYLRLNKLLIKKSE